MPGVAAKGQGRFSVGAKLDGEFVELAARWIGVEIRGGVLRGLSERSWGAAQAE